MLYPVILASRHGRISKMQGKIVIEKKKVGAIRFGIGNNGVIDPRSNRWTFENTGIIHCGGEVSFNAGTCIVNHGQLTIGEDSAFNGNVALICYERITIGNHVFCSWDCEIMDTDFHQIFSEENRVQLNPNSPTIIGDNVWIGTKVLVLKGSVIPDGAIIAATSVVTKQLNQSNSIYVDNERVKDSAFWTP